MNTTTASEDPITLRDAENWLALGAGAVLFVVGASRRSFAGVCLAASSAPLLYRGITGHWPSMGDGREQARGSAGTLSGSRGIEVREAIRVERPPDEVFRFWRQLEQLPRFMSHLVRVTTSSDGRSHWVATGPTGVGVEWDAQIVSETEGRMLAWESLPGADVVTSGTVTFDPTRGGRGTQVAVHLRYLPPAGRAGALVAALFGRAPSQTIREDLRRFKQLLEAGEIPRATPD